MNYAILITRILLGAVFVFFGANIVLHFLPMHPMAGNAGLFMAAIGGTGYMKVVGLLQIVGGLLLLVGRFVPLSLLLLGPVVANVLLFHTFLEPSGLPLALLLLALWVFLLFVYRRSFVGVLAADPLAKPTI